MKKKGDSYTEIQGDDKFMDIIECVLLADGPLTGAEIAQAVGLASGTAMCHIKMAVRRKWLSEDGGRYDYGSRQLGLLAAKIRGLKDQRDGISRKIATLEV